MTTRSGEPVPGDTPAAVATCATCAALLLPLAEGNALRWVCPRCPLPRPVDAEVLARRWWVWLADHDVPLGTPPCSSPAMWWAPAARTLLVVGAAPDQRVVDGAVRRGVEHGWDVVWLGDRPESMHVLLDNHLEGHPDPQRHRPHRVRLPHESDRPDGTVLAGHCTSCGVFQWHTTWGWWMCRACGHADGDTTLEVATLHYTGDTNSNGRPRCVTCRTAWEAETHPPTI